jgi:hypothetical protein
MTRTLSAATQAALAPAAPTSPSGCVRIGHGDTEQQLSEWVQRALDHAGMKQAELARILRDQSGLVTIDRSALNKIVLGTRKLSAEEMLEVSRITGYPIPDRRIGKSKPSEKVDEHPKVADDRPIERPDNKDISRATPGSPELETRLAVAGADLRAAGEMLEAARGMPEAVRASLATTGRRKLSGWRPRHRRSNRLVHGGRD